MSSAEHIQRTGLLGEQKRIAIIPAKLKSRRCRDKNWRPFVADECLAERAFNKAIGSGFFHFTLLSIDFPEEDVEFLKKPRNPAMRVGMGIRRRPKLMVDDSTEVVKDALEFCKADDNDIYCLLQPTSPFVEKTSIWRALQCVASSRNKVVSVTPAYKPSGGIYAGLVKDIKKYNDFYKPFVTPLVLDWMECIDVDYEYDFEIARCLLE